MDWEDGLLDFKKDVSKTLLKSPHSPKVPSLSKSLPTFQKSPHFPKVPSLSKSPPTFQKFPYFPKVTAYKAIFFN
jgi:ABC-type antimicrobial peptide transport system ATPase subunit